MSEEPKPMYVQCAVCGFWVTQEQPSCPNCGIVEPTNTELWEGFGQSRILDLVNVFGVSALLIWIGSGVMKTLIMTLIDVSQWGISGWGIRLISGAVIAGALTWYHRRRFKRRHRDCFQRIEESLQGKLEPPQPLRETEQQLTQRISELRQKGEDVTALEKALSTVREALSVATRQSFHARIMQHKIAMLRWQNKLEPLIVDQPMDADVAEWQRRLQEVEEIRAEGQTLAAQFAEQSDLLTLSEGAQLQQAWSESLAGCERLKNELLTRQAVAASESVKPLEEVVPLSQVGKTTADALRYVLVTHDFGDLSTAVKNLREQEARLQAEREQAEQRARQAQRLQ